MAKLLESGAAYRCFCTKEELEAEREHAVAEKLDYHYFGKCRALDSATVERYIAEERPYTVRFRVPEGESAFDDLVHGRTVFQNDTIGDFIIARADGSPVYLLGVAVDDADMSITLVMRAMTIYRTHRSRSCSCKRSGPPYRGSRICRRCLVRTKRKLSKRHGAASVLEYRNMGVLAPALVNFLALLGWSPGGDREKMATLELVEAFSIEDISKKSGVFDIQKLEWLNGQF